jgi:predicted PurR-regulated permease PerM
VTTTKGAAEEAGTAPTSSRVDLSGLLTRSGLYAWAIVGLLVAGWLLLLLLSQFDVLLGPIVLSIVLIYVLNPIVGRLQKAGLHRIVGSIVAFSLLIGGIVLIGFLIWPSVSSQARELAANFETIYEDTVTDVEQMLADVGIDNVVLWTYADLQDFISDPENQDQFISGALDRLGALTAGLFEAVLLFLVAPVVAFYALIDLPRIRRESTELIPPDHRTEVVYVSRQLSTAVGGFLRGQLLVAFIVGAMTSFGFWLIDLDFWLLIGMIAGFLNIIPFVGPWVGGILGALVGLATGGLPQALLAALVAVIVQQIDNNLVSPTVLRATVRLHPAVVILVLILGGALGGVWGVLLAVPVAASIKIVAGHFWRTRVLGQSWVEATDALIVEPEPRQSLLSRVRRAGDGGADGEVEDVNPDEVNPDEVNPDEVNPDEVSRGEGNSREPEADDSPLDG